MNPNRAENHANTEVIRVPENAELAGGQEAPAAVAESSPGKQAPQAAPAIPAVDPASLAQAASDISVTGQQDSTQSSASASKPGAGDKIEKEWVNRAKAIVAKTKDDPRAQKEAVSKVKAEYIQKRFNKTIITDEATPA